MDDGEGLGASWFRVLIVWFDSPKWPSLGNLSPAWARRAVAARVPLTTFSTAQCLQKKISTASGDSYFALQASITVYFFTIVL